MKGKKMKRRTFLKTLAAITAVAAIPFEALAEGFKSFISNGKRVIWSSTIGKKWRRFDATFKASDKDLRLSSHQGEYISYNCFQPGKQYRVRGYWRKGPNYTEYDDLSAVESPSSWFSRFRKRFNGEEPKNE